MHNWMYKTLLATLLTVLLSSVSASEFSTLLQLEHLRDAEVITQEHRDSLEKSIRKARCGVSAAKCAIAVKY